MSVLFTCPSTKAAFHVEEEDDEEDAADTESVGSSGGFMLEEAAEEPEGEGEEVSAGCEAAEAAVTPAPAGRGGRVVLSDAAGRLNKEPTTVGTTGRAQPVAKPVAQRVARPAARRAAPAEPEVDAGSLFEATPEETIAETEALLAETEKVDTKADLDDFKKAYGSEAAGPCGSCPPRHPPNML